MSSKIGVWNAKRKLDKVGLQVSEMSTGRDGESWTIESKDISERPATPAPKSIIKSKPNPDTLRYTIEKEQHEKYQKRKEKFHGMAEAIREKNKRSSTAFKDRAISQEQQKIISTRIVVHNKQQKFEDRQRELFEEKRRQRAARERKRQQVLECKTDQSRCSTPAYLDMVPDLDDMTQGSDSPAEELQGAVGGASPSPPPETRRRLPTRLPQLEHHASLPPIDLNAIASFSPTVIHVEESDVRIDTVTTQEENIQAEDQNSQPDKDAEASRTNQTNSTTCRVKSYYFSYDDAENKDM